MPVAILKVSPEMPELDHGEIAENPIPAPNANSNKVKAAIATPPAAIAAQDTADRFSSTAPARISGLKLSVTVMAMLSLSTTPEQHSDGVKSSGGAACACANSASHKASR